MDPIKIRNILFFSMFSLVCILFLFMIKPFFFPVFWAVVIAAIFHPVYARLQKVLKSPNMAATTVIFLIIMIIILPALVIGSLLLSESLDLYNTLDMSTVSIDEQVRNIANRMSGNPLLRKMSVDTAVVTGAITDSAKGIANFIFQNLRDLTQNMVIFIAQFAIMLYTLFFFIRDGSAFLEILARLFPIGHDRERMLFKSFSVTARATLKVTLIIGGLQGVLGGFLFFFLNVKAALTWGVVMIFSSIIPGVGCSIVWFPAAIIMILTGHLWKGIVILVFGALVISMVDNFLRPLLLGHDVQMHPLLIFLSTLGGIMLFGISGFVLGPIVTSILFAFWKMYDDLYHRDAI
ncbi:MAG: putative transport protein [Syntrophus sp. SKADARSKE-3]|nr:putative transport protein [Syntrophus sp. SKADARSKE-3]